MIVPTALTDFSIRHANADDVGLILEFIRELAIYEKLEDQVVATEQILEQSLFGDSPYGRVLIGERAGEPVAYALYFFSFSTFTGRPGLYLEDLYVRPQHRGAGYGKCLLTYLATVAIEHDCTRLEWSVLDWNEPSLRFYRALGATAMDGWTVHRLDGEALSKAASEFN